MLNLAKVEVPATQEQDFNVNQNVWVNGKLKIARGAYHDTYFILHENREVPEMTTINEDDKEVTTTYQAVFALPVVVSKPATYESVVNAAERVAYNLNSDAEAISFTASLARRSRLNPNDLETLEHDQFMNQILEEVKPLFQ